MRSERVTDSSPILVLFWPIKALAACIRSFRYMLTYVAHVVLRAVGEHVLYSELNAFKDDAVHHLDLQGA
eukprot:6188750-Pyramimonas_sp.AAC.1